MDITAEGRAMHQTILDAMSGEAKAAHTCGICDLIEQERAVTTYTEDEYKAKSAEDVATATAALQAKLDEAAAKLAEATASTRGAEVEQAVAEATAESAAEITALQAKLDDAAAAQKVAEDGLAERLAKDEEAEAAAAQAALEADRAAKVKEIKLFKDDYVDDNVSRWASMSDEAFTAQLAEYTEIKANGGAPKVEPKVETASELPSGVSAMLATADAGDDPKVSPRRLVLDAGRNGMPISSI